MSERKRSTTVEEIASEKRVQDVLNRIKQTFNNLDMDEVYKEIEQDGRTHTPEYNALLSVLAGQFLLEFGFDNQIFIQLQVEPFIGNSNIFKWNKYDFQMSAELRKYLDIYLSVRKKIVAETETTCGDLFIRFDGGRCTNTHEQVNADLLFKCLGESVATTPFQKRYIARAMLCGQNIFSITNATGNSVNTCKKVYESLYAKNNSLHTIISATPLIKETSISMQCPVCGEYVSSASTAWVLVQHDDDSRTLACRHCKGVPQ